jgi:lipoprotein-releasing system permease protein
LDDNFVFVNITSARKALAMSEQQTHEFVLTFVNPQDAENPDSEIFQQLNNEEIETLGWLEINRELGAIIELSAYSSFIVGAILFLLASLGVINSMFMSIYERIYEFGVIKAIGTRPAEITKLILCEALLLALISCGFGMLLGFAFSSWSAANGISLGEMEFSGVALSNNIFSEFHVSQFTQFPIYVVLLTIAAAIYPARFAAKIVPSEALQRSL